MVTPTELTKQPSALDLATIEHRSDGSKRIIYLDEHAVENAAAAREAWHRHNEAAAAEREREMHITERVKEALVAGPNDGAVDDGTARTAWQRHVGWVDQVRQQAGAADQRKAVTAEAAARNRWAKQELSAIEGETRLQHDIWLRSDVGTPQPASRAAELADLRDVIATTEQMARLADPAAYEAAVAHAIAEAVTAMIPLRRNQAFLEDAAVDLDQQARSIEAALAAVYTRMLALDEAVALPDDDALTLRQLGVPPLRTMLGRSPKAELPSVRGEQRGFEVRAEPIDVETYRAELATFRIEMPQQQTETLLSTPASLTDRVTKALRIRKGD